MKNRTLLMVKPDGVKRKLVGEVVARIERKGLEIVNIKMLTMTKELASIFYSEHKDKNFFPKLIDYITSGPVVSILIEGEEAASVIRKMIGATKPEEREPGTIRGDFSLDLTENIVHASATLQDAEREIHLFFN